MVAPTLTRLFLHLPSCMKAGHYRFSSEHHRLRSGLRIFLAANLSPVCSYKMRMVPLSDLIGKESSCTMSWWPAHSWELKRESAGQRLPYSKIWDGTMLTTGSVTTLTLGIRKDALFIQMLVMEILVFQNISAMPTQCRQFLNAQVIF